MFSGQSQKFAPSKSLHVFTDVLPCTADFSDLNFKLLSMQARLFLRNVGDRLFTKSPEKRIESSLAKGYSCSPSGLLFRFQIDSEKRFHDGSEITANDVIKSLERGFGTLALQVTGLEFVRVSRFRFEIRLQKKIPDFLEILSCEELTITKNGTLPCDGGVLSGAYKVVERQEDLFRLEANVTESVDSSEFYQEILWRKIPQPTSSLTLLFRDAHILVISQELSGLSTTIFEEYHANLKIFNSGLVLCLTSDTPSSEAIQLRAAMYSVTQSAGFLSGFGHMQTLNGMFPRSHALHSPIPFVNPELSGRTITATVYEWERFISKEKSEFFSKKFLRSGLDVKFEKPSLEKAKPGMKIHLRAFEIGQRLCYFDACSYLLSEWNPLGALPPSASSLIKNFHQWQNSVPSLEAFTQTLKALFKEISISLPVCPFAFIPHLMIHSDHVKLIESPQHPSELHFQKIRQRQAPVDREALRRTQLEAIGATTQMFAHDVRKPFSLLRLMIEMMQSTNSLAEMRSVMKKVVPEIDFAMRSVNSMIEDVMEIGAQNVLRFESVAPETLLETALREVFRIHYDTHIEISYAFNHARPVKVDILKVLRIFSNILINSIQAMKKSGRIWIHTCAAEQGYLQFTIGNSNSRLKSEDISLIFDAFFTKEKRGGTGLGLAICQKIVREHGGRIWCTLPENDGVEFHFTLPLGQEPLILSRPHLPQTSKDIENELRTLPSNYEESAQGETELAREIDVITFVRQTGRKISVLVVDDENIYRSLLNSQLGNSIELKECVVLLGASNAIEATTQVERNAPDVLICDIDLGHESETGFELVKSLRHKGFAGHICIHSNQFGATIYRESLAAGADLFLPKPLTRAHLLNLVWSVVSAHRKNTELAPLIAHHPTSQSPFKVIVVDDDPFFLEAWEKKISKDRCIGFSKPEDCLRFLKSVPEDFGIRCIVTDYYFEDFSFTGEDFAIEVRKRGISLPMYLCSDGEFDSETLQVFQGRVAKMPLTAEDLQNLFPALK